MGKLNKLHINSEKSMNNEELLTLRGGYDGGSCGNDKEWSCDVTFEGSYAFSGKACGTQEYISGVCSSLGYSCSCTETMNSMEIFVR